MWWRHIACLRFMLRFQFHNHRTVPIAISQKPYKSCMPLWTFPFIKVFICCDMRLVLIGCPHFHEFHITLKPSGTCGNGKDSTHKTRECHNWWNSKSHNQIQLTNFIPAALIGLGLFSYHNSPWYHKYDAWLWTPPKSDQPSIISRHTQCECLGMARQALLCHTSGLRNWRWHLDDRQLNLFDG